MLRELQIENLAVIEKASISFGSSFNAFTGETGAGKSILIGGINAILGGRVSKDIVRNGAEKSVVAGAFDDIPENVVSLLLQNGFDNSEMLILQREIFADGKSTAKINGRLTTVSVLREIAGELIDIHGQHDNRILTDADKQREILDSYGEIGDILSQYREHFKEFSALSKKINTLTKQSEFDKEKAELLKERIAELKTYDFKFGEEEEITKKLNILRNAETISENLTACLAALNGDEDSPGAYSLLRDCRTHISGLSSDINGFDKLEERLSQLIIDLDDIKQEISVNVPDDSEDVYSEISVLEERLSAIIKLKRKYGKELDEIISDCEQWKEELQDLDCSDEVLNDLHDRRKNEGEQVKKLAAEITEKRKKTAEILAKRISKELEFLDMPDIRLVFSIDKDKVTVNGMDSVEMLISVNKGEDLKPMSKIASGGELSRIMLAVKNVLAKTDNIATMIFDEIDTGISGRAAQKVAVKLSEISDERQVICVTHLAQIASAADTHFLIQKDSDDKRTYTTVKKLDFDERKKEIARIISGVDNSDSSLETAEELLTRNKKK